MTLAAAPGVAHTRVIFTIRALSSACTTTLLQDNRLAHGHCIVLAALRVTDRYSQPRCSAMRAASTQFWAPSF